MSSSIEALFGHVVVVGGTRGLGLACVRRLLGEVRVSVLARRIPAETERCPGVCYYAGDAQMAETLSPVFARMREEGGPLTGLAAFQRFRGEDSSWEGNIAASLTATKNLVEQALPYFQEQGDRSIVLMASPAAQAVADEQTAGYHAAKAGLIGLCRYYAFTLGAQGIRVNTVSPGTVIKEAAKAGFDQKPELKRLFERIIPLRRMGTDREVASVVRFLLSSESSFITGQDLVVDGGSSLHWQESLARSLVGHQFKS